MINLKSQTTVDEADPATQKWLEKLQGNILRGHGREFGVYIFFSFEDASQTICRNTIRDLAAFVTSARQQYVDTVRYRKTGLPGAMFGNLFLTVDGYRRLGYDAAEKLNEEPVEGPDEILEPSVTFVDGMAKGGAALGDPPQDCWDQGYQPELHAMLLLADDDEAHLGRIAREVVLDLEARQHVVHASERGRALRNDNGEGIEHFGYVDGRSQPLFLREDFQISADGTRHHERDGGRLHHWDSFAPLDLVLRPDPFAKEDDCFGSYLVFRKLEQNVQRFHMRLNEMADALHLVGEDRERAGAMVMGRFRDGSPVVLTRTSGWHPVEDNDFTYRQDLFGERCPLQAHTRKANPRGDSGRDTANPHDRLHRIVRRSITYGRRSAAPASSWSPEHLPTEKVGLLFMCFQASICRQFAFIQTRWCNDKLFHIQGGGIDPIIGQGVDAGDPQAWSAMYNHPERQDFGFSDFVKLKGGEFFFAPSIPFLHSL